MHTRRFRGIALSRCSNYAATFILALAALGLAPRLLAQAAPAGATPPPPDEEIVVLSPFEVTSSSDVGYEARDTLAGSRLKTDLKDIPSQVEVMTSQFLEDMAITDLNEAIGYSLNVETAAQTFDVTSENIAGNENSIQAFAGSPRSRGLSGVTIGRDFFQTRVPGDSYNTERITFAPGANNALFGNSTPAGAIGISTKRAMAHKRLYSVAFRVDSEGSTRTTVDVNVPIVKNRLAVRWVGLRERSETFREPSFRDQDRSFITITANPWRSVSIRGWYEDYSSHAQPIRNTLVRDLVTPWIEAGSPAFDNRLKAAGGSFPPAATSRTAPFFRFPSGRTQPYYYMDSTGGIELTRQTNTVQTVGEARLSSAPDNFDWSVINPDLVPLEVGITGNAIQNLQHGRNYGAVINANPVKNLWIEAGTSTEVFKHRFIDLFRYSDLRLYADANLYLQDQVTPNPNFGRYYLEDSINFAGVTLNTFDQTRLSAAYKLDFTGQRNWMKWLGRYTFSGFYEKLEQRNAGAGQRFDPILTAAYPGGPAGTATATRFRWYLPDAQHPGTYAINLPFDPLAEGNIPLPNSGGYEIRGYNSPIGAQSGGWPGRTVVRSKVLAAQGYLFDDRMVLTFSRRQDDVARSSVTGLDFPRLESGGFAYLDQVYDLPSESDYSESSRGVKSNNNSGVVVHPTRWLSLHYANLANGQVTGLTRHNLDGTDAELGSGKGKEYGFTLRLFKNRVSVRLNRYESFLTGIQGSSLGGVNPVPTDTVHGGGNSIRDDLPALEQAALQAGAPLSDRFRVWDELLLAQTFPEENPASDSTTNRDNFDFIVDRESKGYEVTVAGNPTPSWRLAISAAKNESRESNLAPQYFELIAERMPVWAQYLTAPTWRDGQTLADLLQPSIGNFYFIQAAAGQPNVMDRKYRVTATTAYNFREGRLKGLRVGANYTWRSSAAVGFTPITVTDNPYQVPGLTTATITINDPLNPTRGGPVTTFDAFAGYRLKLFKGKVSWDIQLNVRNVFDKQDLLVQRASSDGVGHLFTLQTPRTFILSNTFTF